MLEDAGEMVMVSLIAWYTWTFITHDEYLREKESGKTEDPVKRSIAVKHKPLSKNKEKQVPQPVGSYLKTAKK